MTDNGIQVKNIEEAVSIAFTKLMSKKVGIVCFAMYVDSGLVKPIMEAKDPITRYCLVGVAVIIALLAAYAFHGQTELDKMELRITGKDQPDNGYGSHHTETPDTPEVTT